MKPARWWLAIALIVALASGPAAGQSTPRQDDSPVETAAMLTSLEELSVAQVYEAQRDFAGAIETTRSALSALVNGGGRGSTEAAYVQLLLAQRIVNGGDDHDEARALARDATHIFRERLGEDHEHTQRAMRVYADMLAGQPSFETDMATSMVRQLLFSMRPLPPLTAAAVLFGAESEAESAENANDAVTAARAWRALGAYARANGINNPTLEAYLSYRLLRISPDSGEAEQDDLVERLRAIAVSGEARDGDALLALARHIAVDGEWGLAAAVAGQANDVYRRASAPASAVSSALSLQSIADAQDGNIPRALQTTTLLLERSTAAYGECAPQSLPLLERAASLGAALDGDTAILNDRRILRCWRDRGTFTASLDDVQQRTQGVLTANAAQRLVGRAWDIVSRRPSTEDFLLEEAFETQQLARYVSAASAFGSSAARVATGGAGGPWDQAIARLAVVELEMVAAADDADDGHRARARTARAELLATLRTLETDIDTRAPRLNELLRGDPLTIEQLQARSGANAALLGEDEALILISSDSSTSPRGARNGYIFVVTKDDAAWAALPLTPEELAVEIDALREALDIYGPARGFSAAERTPAREQRPFDRARAHRLYLSLFGDEEIAGLLANKPRWLIAPQGRLLSLPFAALVMEVPAAGRRGDADPAGLRATSWLGLERTLSTLPSVSTLAMLRRDRPRGGNDQLPFFGVGDPVFAGAANSRGASDNMLVRTGVGVDEVRRLSPLPGTRIEIETLARTLNADPQDILLGPRASEPGLQAARPRLARARVIAFATHGLIAGDVSGLTEPALALTPPTRTSVAMATDDGLLTASEASALSLTADWVILSACNTAAGDGSAEGLSGLARAFLYAGARSLLVSHWRIRDDVATRLTTRAIALSVQHDSRAEALRAAMREVIDDRRQDGSGYSFAHPAAWAPFAFVGA